MRARTELPQSRFRSRLESEQGPPTSGGGRATLTYLCNAGADTSAEERFDGRLSAPDRRLYGAALGTVCLPFGSV